MAGITLAEAEAQLQAWLAASTALASNKSYTMPGGRNLTRADAGEVLQMIAFFERKVQELSRSSGRVTVRRITPVSS